MAWSPEADISLAPLTTWKIGGPAQWFASPANRDELIRCLEWAAQNSVPLTVMGRGSNILISDEGLRGLVVCLRSYDNDSARFLENKDGIRCVEVSAGMSLPRLSKKIAQADFAGYEFYIGIPGTVGGAIIMNAGFGPGDERQTANRCLEVEIMEPDGQAEWHPYSHFNPVYRHTDLVDSSSIVTAARFRLGDPSSRESIRATTAEHLGMRRTRQPLTRPTAGSVFKGTGDGVPAAVYIDRCGLKGACRGGAMVSLKHANWIENTGSATAADVAALIEHIQATVREQEGIDLETEVRFLG